jgi:hypothetical protein
LTVVYQELEAYNDMHTFITIISFIVNVNISDSNKFAVCRIQHNSQYFCDDPPAVERINLTFVVKVYDTLEQAKDSIFRNEQGIYLIRSSEQYNIEFTIPDQIIPYSNTQTGGKQKMKYKNRSYVIRTGSRGGKYILVKDKKVYI